MNEAPPTPSLARRVLSVLVGLFAVWQLVFLPAANLVVFVPLRPFAAPLEPPGNAYQARGTFTTAEPLQSAADRGGRVLEFWGELSGQEQGWSLFAPGTPPYSVFVAVEMQWPDGTSDTMLSRYEPRDHENPALRAPCFHNRHFHFESQFVSPVWYASPEAVAEHPEMWADLPDTVRGLRPEIRAWLGWRVKEYLAAHPNRERPRAVVLKHRFIDTPKPGDPPGAPRTVTERPFARWWPDLDTLDAFDVVKKHYVPTGVWP